MCEVRFPFIGITIQVDPVAFRIGTFEVYWYGILIAAAMILCGWLAVRHSKSNKFSEDLVYDVLLVSLPSAIIGARLYYVFCEWEYYSQDIRRIFDTRSGGLAVYGGILGAVLGTYIMCRIRKIPFSTVLDYCIVYIPLGQAIGRWGNFFNQEAFGTTTTLPWGMTSSKISHYLETYCPDLDPSMPVHPTFLYESLCTTAIFLVLLLAVRPNSERRFETASVYMVLYGIARFFIEGLRTDSLYIGNTSIRTSQLLSLIFVIVALAYIAYARTQKFEKKGFPQKLYVELTEEKK